MLSAAFKMRWMRPKLSCRCWATDQVRFTVGVGPGTYLGWARVPSYVSLVGSDTENTNLHNTVNFIGVVQAEVRNFTFWVPTAGVFIVDYASDISVANNIFRTGQFGVLVLDSTAVEIQIQHVL